MEEGWCPESDLNQRPTAYEAVALPLSYRGAVAVDVLLAKRSRQRNKENAFGITFVGLRGSMARHTI